jgi:hypothetical protein
MIIGGIEAKEVGGDNGRFQLPGGIRTIFGKRTLVFGSCAALVLNNDLAVAKYFVLAGALE